MPVDSAPIGARLGKPGDLRHPVANRDQRHPTVSAATQANPRDLAKRHVDHAAHSQPVLVRLTVSQGERLREHRGEHTTIANDFSSSFLLNSARKMAMPLRSI